MNEHPDNIITLGRWNELVLLGDDQGEIHGLAIDPIVYDIYIEAHQDRHAVYARCEKVRRLSSYEWKKKTWRDEPDMEEAAERDLKPVKLVNLPPVTIEYAVARRPKPMVMWKMLDPDELQPELDLKIDRVDLRKSSYIKSEGGKRVLEVRAGYHDPTMTWYKAGASKLYIWSEDCNKYLWCKRRDGDKVI